MRCCRHLSWIVLVASLAALPAWAAMGLEIISLRHRVADEVLPSIRPFLVPGATATGMNEKLFVRTTPENLAEIRRLLATLDRQPRRLVVRLRRDGDASVVTRGAEVSGEVALGRNARVIVPPAEGGREPGRGGGTRLEARVLDSRSASRELGLQSVQVVEGGRAFVAVGSSLALPLRRVFVGPQGPVWSETVEIRDIGSGFEVEPRLVGDRVTLEISQVHEAPAGPGAVSTQRLATTVSGRLGEWIALGGTQQDAGGERRATLGAATREVRDSRGLWLLVEELP